MYFLVHTDLFFIKTPDYISLTTRFFVNFAN